MKVTLSIAILFLAFCTDIIGQNKSLTIHLDSGVIYLGKLAGGSTHSIRLQSKHADSLSSSAKSNFSAIYLDTLSFLLSSIKRQRHFQQKVGEANYAKVYHRGSSVQLAFIPGWAILHLDNDRTYQYIVRDTEFADTFERFIKSNWNISPSASSRD
jgi:hypothetical protein